LGHICAATRDLIAADFLRKALRMGK
jgi:hypothetical protein